ncbi:MAG: methionyl-tRNA formyltransferase, partial [Candidatus Omnitrophica bacterium]|nr:methionyl-tRNA formyltransferase [Candidatus Omnitrophota bacterium]
VLSIPKLYSINLHGSLLPEYRGAAPTNWAIINGERTSGVTVIRMNERMDEGDIILQREVKIGEEDTNITLSEKLSELGAEALSEAIGLIEKKSVTFTKQDSAKASYAPKLKKEDGIIDWSDPALKIHNKVRGLIPWPGAYTHFEGRILKIWETKVLDSPSDRTVKNGKVIDIIKNKGIVIKTASDSLVIKYLQLEGKRILDADSFLRGHRIEKGYRFS